MNRSAEGAGFEHMNRSAEGAQYNSQGQARAKRARRPW
jgi:hypothetical protein